MELQSGQNIALTQNLLRITVSYPKAATFGSDVDASAFMLTAQNKVRGDDDFIFFNQPAAPNGSLSLTTSGERSLFSLDLSKIDADITKIAITVVIDGPDSISGLQQIQLNVEGVAVFNVPLADRSEKALILGEVYRHNSGWKLRASGQGFSGGLEPLAVNFGVDVSSPSPVPAAVITTVSLEKRIQEKAPRIISLAKTATVSLTKHNLQSAKAKVVFVVGASGSLADAFTNGNVQAMLERAAVLAMQLEGVDNMEMWGFANKHRKYPNVTLIILKGTWQASAILTELMSQKSYLDWDTVIMNPLCSKRLSRLFSTVIYLSTWCLLQKAISAEPVRSRMRYLARLIIRSSGSLSVSAAEIMEYSRS